MKHLRVCMLCTLLLFECIQLGSQSVSISQNTSSIDKKLTNRLVTDIVRDHQGFLWIGFEDGLSRFDGDKFVQFKYSYPEPRHISGIRVEKIVPRKDNNLIIKYRYHKNAIEVFDPVTWKGELVTFSAFLKDVGDITDICESADGNEVVVLVSKRGLSSIYFLNNENSLQLLYQVERENAKAISIKQTLQSDWLIFDDGQCVEFDRKGKTRRTFGSPTIEGLNYQRDDFVHFIHEIDDGDCIVSFEASPGLFILRQGADTLADLDNAVEPEFYTDVWKDNKGNRLLYAGSSFRKHQRLFFWVQEQRSLLDVSSWLSNQNQVTALYGEDFLQGFAIGYTNGFDIKHLISGQFSKFLTQDVAPSEWGTSIRGIVKDEYQNTYVAREIDHWFKISENGNVDTLSIIENTDAFEVNFKCSRSLISTGSYIIGSAHFMDDTYAVLMFDPASNQTEVIPIQNHVQHIKQIGDTLWIACGERNHQAALYSFNLLDKEITPYLDSNGQNPFDVDLLFTIEEVRDDVLWIGSRKGVYEVNLKQGTVQHYDDSSAYPYNFIDSWIFDLKRHSDGTMYVGYRSAGFELINLETETKKQFTEYHGLADDDIASFVEDSAGTIWIGTFGGLSKFDPETEEFINFYYSDGLSHNEFNRYSSYIDSDNEILMGSINGLVLFDPTELKITSKESKIILASLQYFDFEGNLCEFLERFDQPIKLEIPAANRSLEFEFQMDNYLSDFDNTFQYQLGEKDKTEWIELGSIHELSLNYLPIGSYPIRIRGKDKYGNISSNEIHVDVHVRQFIYESAWFYAGIALLVIGLTFLIFQAQFVQKIRLFQMRQNISRDLHDEVGSLLTGLAMKTDLLAMKVSPELKMETKKLGGMGRDAVRLMRDIVWSIDSSKNTFGDLFDRIHEFASEVLPEKSILYEVELSGCSPDMKLKSEVRKNVYLITREAINNIIKHSNATHVSIRMTRSSGGNCLLVINDNGNSPELNGSISGLGVRNMHERAKDINGSLKIHRENGYEISLSFIHNQ